MSDLCPFSCYNHRFLHHSTFKQRLLHNPDKLATYLLDNNISTVVIGGTMEVKHFQHYIHLTGAGIAMYPPPDTQWHFAINRTFYQPQFQSNEIAKVSYTGNIPSAKKAYGCDKGMLKTTFEVLSRHTELDGTTYFHTYAAGVKKTSNREGEHVKAKLDNFVANHVTINGPHRDKWKHFYGHGKGGLIYILEFDRKIEKKKDGWLNVGITDGNEHTWFLTSYKPWPMNRPRFSYSPNEPSCDCIIKKIATSVRQYISNQNPL